MFHTKTPPFDPGFPPGPEESRQTRRVALVEDEGDNRESIAEALETEGFRVHALERADEALDLLDSPRCPELFLLDVRMPRMGGREVLAAVALRPDRERFRIILISADARALALADRPRVVEVIPEPFALERLLDAVRRYA
jgi:CheY-like chemotaxis protein